MNIIVDSLARHARRTPDRIAVECAGRTTTFAELDDRARRLAAVLAAPSGGPPRRVAVIARNTDCFYEILLGALLADAVFSALNWRLAAPEMRSVLRNFGADCLFVEPEFRDRFAAEISELARTTRVVTLEDGWRGDLLAGTAPDHGRTTAAGRLGAATAWQLYTSGTTGLPRGAEHSLDAVLAGVEAGMKAKRLDDTDVCLAVLPQFHVGGIMSGVQTLCAGGRVAVMRETGADAMLAEIARSGTTRVFLVPTLVEMLAVAAAASPVLADSLRTVYYGGAPMPLSLLERARTALRCEFVHLYGMTETLGMISYLDSDGTRDAHVLQSVGFPYPEVDVQIRDASGRALAAGEMGEIVCRGPFVMKGYWRNAAETAEALQDGWLRTGDVGLIDPQGRLHVRDRLRDMIITGGENVYPAEIENALLNSRDVAEVAVVGLPDDRWGEVVTAFVVSRAGAVPDEARLIEFVRSQLAGYKVPKQVVFVDALPKNPSGKILRRRIREARLPSMGGADLQQAD